MAEEEEEEEAAAEKEEVIGTTPVSGCDHANGACVVCGCRCP